ncbi:PIN domain-containing protein [Mucilaginibacter kameinonensis]|uniref:PIN domain-containing protein n=1 Tax=Mucilaginibacter kameinonensis TaxID=452286 RepID=UPI000EF78210|nr:PIN domain-containing protein [Mucilaginibacter kameinonensis]
MIKFLVDTCVWLDLAKDPKQETLLMVMEYLMDSEEISLLVPEIITTEFERNKDRIIAESKKSLSSIFSRVKETVNHFGDPGTKNSILDQLSEINQKLPLLNEAVDRSILKIEQLFAKAEIIPTADTIKLRAAQRAIDKRAPFHRAKNSMDDALIIETYAEERTKSPSDTFVFVTHNVKDFSLVAGSDKIPHLDYQDYFEDGRSLYFIKLSEAIQNFNPEFVSEILVGNEMAWEIRPYSELTSVEDELTNRLWYTRHKVRASLIKEGKVKLVNPEDWDDENPESTIVKEIWNGAKKSAKALEVKVGKKNLLPKDDFEYGMLYGKLSAIRWVLGDDWDNFDT